MIDNTPLEDPFEFMKKQVEKEQSERDVSRNEAYRKADEAKAEFEFELRSAFGEGYDVVNVLTGETYKDEGGQ